MSSPINRQIFVRKPFRPDRIARDENGDVIDESQTGLERAPGIKARGFLGSDRQIIHHDLRARFAQFLDDLFAGRFLFQRQESCGPDHSPHVRGIAVENAAHHDDGPGRFDLVAKNFGAIGRGENRLAHIEPHFAAIDVECGHHFDILRPVRPDLRCIKPTSAPLRGVPR